MFGRLFRKWKGGSKGVLPKIPGETDGGSRPREDEEPGEARRPGWSRSLVLPPGEKNEAPPTTPPGWTVREYLNHRIRDRSRWLEGRYGRDKEGTDRRKLLETIQDSSAVAIRRPPLAAQRLLQENRRANASLDNLAEIIETDPALLQSVLKHANSVFYGAGGNPVAAVPPALQRLGSRGIEIVVMSHMVEGALCRPGEGLDDLAGAVWAHMVRVAPLARSLAPGFGVDADEAYVLGLLHDVGKLVLFNRVADLRKRLRRPVRMGTGFIPAALRELHEPMGSLAVLEWGLGEEAALAVAIHHRDPAPQPPSLVGEVVFLAEKLDLITQKGEEAKLEALWAQGKLTTPLDRVAPLWENLRRGEAEAGEEVEVEVEVAAEASAA